jgi:protein phosphatase 2C family protein 2/3
MTKLSSFKAKDYKAALEEAFFKMDDMMLSPAGKKEIMQLNGKDEESFAGCTATTCLITPTEIFCANSGDSRTVLSKNKVAMPLSEDHKPDD